MTHPEGYTIRSAHDALVSGKITSVALTQAYLDAIRSRNPALNAYVEVWESEALQRAAASDARRATGSATHVLDGIPLAIKDNMLYQGQHARAGSRILENHVSAYTNTAVQRLLDAGAVILGVTNMDEFAMGSSTEHSAYGVTHHPRDPERIPGGSSGGSACAVAADLCVAALGSDTGGSIRQPAALCGIVGMKPTYGSVSRYGLIAMASSLDQIGPMTKTVEDAEILFDAIHGRDERDQTTEATQSFAPTRPTSLAGVRIGLPRQCFGEGMSPGVRTRVTEALDTFRRLGAELIEVDLEYTDEALAVYYVLMPCEVSSNLARFDGIRYGVRAEASSLYDTYAQSRGQGIGLEARRRVMLGAYALSKGYYDAYYRQARKVQTLIRRDYARVFEQVDVLVTPTAPSTAFKIDEKTADPLAMYMEDVFTVGVNVAGIPAVSVPCGDSEGLPVGVQIIGQWGKDATMMDVASAFTRLHT